MMTVYHAINYFLELSNTNNPLHNVREKTPGITCAKAQDARLDLIPDLTGVSPSPKA